MTAPHTPSDAEIERQLNDYLRLTTDVETPPRIQEITAMSLQNRSRMWITVATTAVVAAIAVVIAIVALAGHNNVAGAPASTPTPLVVVTPTASSTAVSATPAPTSATSASPSGVDTSGWKQLADSTGKYTFSYPTAWKVSGPCTSSGQMVGDPTHREVRVGPGALGCGNDMSGDYITLDTQTGSSMAQPDPSSYPGCKDVETHVTVDGVTGTRDQISQCQGTAFTSYLFSTGGRQYQITGSPSSDISQAVIDAVVMQTLNFS